VLDHARSERFTVLPAIITDRDLQGGTGGALGVWISTSQTCTCRNSCTITQTIHGSPTMISSQRRPDQRGLILSSNPQVLMVCQVASIYSQSVVGSGMGKPSSFSPSMWKAIASLMSCFTLQHQQPIGVFEVLFELLNGFPLARDLGVLQNFAEPEPFASPEHHG
jgi:hypothetical protein